MKKIIYIIIPFVVILVPFILGIAMVIVPFRYKLHAYSAAANLGNIIAYSNAKDRDRKRKSKSLCYYDPDNAYKKMDSFSWDVPNVLTPFVGSAPEPGKHDNAYINSMQFRSKKEIPNSKAPNTYRILITGGSTAYGVGAPNQESLIGMYLNNILAKKLTPLSKMQYEVFTLANPAWTSTQERIIIENKLSELLPDMVISVSGCNDLHWGLLGNNVFCFRTYYDQYFLNIVNLFYRFTGMSRMPEVVNGDSSPVPLSIVTYRIEKNIRLSCFALSMKNVKYVFVLQPMLYVTSKRLSPDEKEHLADNKSHKDYFFHGYNEIRRLLTNMDIANFYFIDESDVFAELTENDHIFIDSYHFGDRGNDIIARNIFKDIRKIIFPQ